MTPRICSICLKPDSQPPFNSYYGAIVSGDWLEFAHRPHNVFAHATCVMELLVGLREEHRHFLHRVQRKMQAAPPNNGRNLGD